MEEISKPIETIVKQGNPDEIWGVSSCKSYRSYLTKRTEQNRKKGNLEIVFILEHLLQAYNHFHPANKVGVEIKGWKGKSSFDIIKNIDTLTIVKHQRKDRESQPEQIRTEVNKAELQAMIDAIIKLKENQPIKTSQLSVIYSRLLGLEHSGWKKGDNPIFSDRSFHNKYTLILDALDELKLIKYSNGEIVISNNKLSIQEIL